MAAALGIALMSFTRVDRRRPRLRRERRAGSQGEPGAAGRQARQRLAAPCSAPCRRAAACRRRRSIAWPARTASWRGWSPAAHRCDAAAAGAAHQPDAAGDAGRCRHRLLDRPDQARRVSRILSVRRAEFIWAVAAFAGVMLLGTLKGFSSRSSSRWLRSRSRPPTRRSTSSAASAAPTSSARCRPSSPTMRPSRAC